MRARAALVALCLGLAGAGCDAAVESGLDEAQANEVVVALDARGVAATKEAEEGTSDTPHFRVLVAREDVARSLAVLRDASLPRHAQPGLADVFGEGGLVPTATEERAKYTAALSGELARSLEQIDGVLSARVHVALPDAHDLPLDGPAPRPRASVMIRYRYGPVPYTERQIRALVAGAVDGMQAEDVAVVGIAAPRVSAATTSSLVRVGPIATTRGSAGTLKLVLAATLGTNVLLAGGLVALALRRRRAAAATEPADAPPA